MRHDFLDKYATLDTPVHRLDPRAKIIMAFSAIAIITSEPFGELTAFGCYFFILGATVVLSRIPLSYIGKRCLIASPFILAAVILLPVSFLLSGDYLSSDFTRVVLWPLSILLKAFAALLVLTLLTAVEKMHTLLSALRWLKVPAVFGVISALMYRYIFILADEMLRTGRARESRTINHGSLNVATAYGNQAAMVFIRGWERADFIYRAMLARGFSGEFPLYKKLKFTVKDGVVMTTFIFILIMVRFLR